MESTAYLSWSDAPHVKLSFDFLPVGQRDMQEDNPISRHLKLEVGPVAAGLRFYRLCEQGTHPRVRHIRFNGDPRPLDRFAGSVRQLESDSNWSNLRRFRGYLVLNRNQGRRLDRSRTANSDQSRGASEPVEN